MLKSKFTASYTIIYIKIKWLILVNVHLWLFTKKYRLAVTLRALAAQIWHGMVDPEARNRTKGHWMVGEAVVTTVHCSPVFWTNSAGLRLVLLVGEVPALHPNPRGSVLDGVTFS